MIRAIMKKAGQLAQARYKLRTILSSMHPLRVQEHVSNIPQLWGINVVVKLVMELKSLCPATGPSGVLPRVF
jgi:hypothetical protein